jgi:hypothetical protein
MYCRNCANEILPEAIACLKCGVPPMKGNNYCYNCALQTHPDAVICVHCGVSLANRKSFVVPSNLKNEKLQNALRVPSFWAAVVIIIMFFRPWVSFGFVTISGWELRDIVRLIRMFDEDFSANEFINLMYFLPVLSCLIIASFFVNSNFLNKRIRTWKILTGLYPWIFFFSLLFVGVKHQTDWMAYGFYLTLVAAGYLLYDGIFLSKKKDKDIFNSVAVHNVYEPNINKNTAIEEDKVSNAPDKKQQIQPPIVHELVTNTQETEEYRTSYEEAFPQQQNNGALIGGGVILIFIIMGVVFLIKNQNTANAGTQTEQITPEEQRDSTSDVSQQMLLSSASQNQTPSANIMGDWVVAQEFIKDEFPPTNNHLQIGKDTSFWVAFDCPMFFKNEWTADTLTLVFDYAPAPTETSGIPYYGPTPAHNSVFAKLFLSNNNELSTIYYNNEFITALQNYSLKTTYEAVQFPPRLFKFIKTIFVPVDLKVSAYLVYDDSTLSSFNIINNHSISLWNTVAGEGSAKKASTKTMIFLEGHCSNVPIKVTNGNKEVYNKTLSINGMAEIIIENTGCRRLTINVAPPSGKPESYDIDYECGE